MADSISTKTIPELQQKSTLTDTDNIVLANNGTAYMRRAILPDLAKYIRTALGFPSGTQTLTEIINGLANRIQTEVYNLQYSTAIASGTDLNTIITPGIYYANSDSIANSCENSPVSTRFKLVVERAAGPSASYYRQTLYKTVSNTETYNRYTTSSGSSWSAWALNATDKNGVMQKYLSTKVTSLSDIPINTIGYVNLDATISPTGSTTTFSYIHFGYGNAGALLVQKNSRRWAKWHNNSSSWDDWVGDTVSPTISVSSITGGHKFTITDGSGTHSVNVMDGSAGRNGTNGTSPTIGTSEITNGTRLTITDVEGTRNVDILNGSGFTWNLIINTTVPDVSDPEKYPRIFNQVTATNVNDYGDVTVAEHGIRTTITRQIRPFIRFGHNTDPYQGLHGLVPGKTYTFSADATMKMFSGSGNMTANPALVCQVYDDHSNPGTSALVQTFRFLEHPVEERGEVQSGRIEFTYTVPLQTTKIRFYISGSYSGVTYYGVGDYLELANIKLEEGSRVNVWTPAYQDLLPASTT